MAVGLFSLALAYGLGWTGPVIRSDGLAYYLYLPATFIDRDLSLQTTVARSFHGEPPEWAGINVVPGTDRLLIKFPVGEALMLAPFFLAGDVTTLAGRWAPPNGLSTPYQAAVAIGGLAYLGLGLWWLWGLLATRFDPAIVRWTVLTLTFGTNLFHYGTYDNTFSHVYAFAAVAGCLLATARWYAKPGAATTMMLAVAGGLVTLVRPTNSVVLLAVVTYGLWSAASVRERVSFWRRHARWCALGMAAYLAVVGVQLSYWKYVTGHWIVYAYTDERFNFAHPEILNVLFSMRKGLYFWAPVLVAATAGFALLVRRAPEWRLPVAAVLPTNLYIIASWHDWAYGGSFGHRAFVESMPFFALGLASLFQWATDTGRQRSAVVCSCGFVVLSCLLMEKYWVHLLPYDRTTWPQLVSALTRWAP